MKTWGAIQLIVLLLAYIIPYTALRDAGGWILYIYWLVLGAISVIVAWTGTRGWLKSG
jgi:hypothetical protein